MGRLSDQLRDPWGLVAGGISGGLAWAVTSAALGPAALALGVGVGALVYGAKAVAALFVDGDREQARPRTPDLPRPPRGSIAEGWLVRAERAVGAMDDLAGTAEAGFTGEAVRSGAEEAGDTLTAMGRVAAQVTAVEAALSRADAGTLEEEAARLDQTLQGAQDPALRAEVERSVQAVRDRIEVRDRLRAARETLLARMQAVALGLEGLVARLAEVLALAATSGGIDTTANDVTDLTNELEGLRAGLVETEALSRRVLAVDGRSGGPA